MVTWSSGCKVRALRSTLPGQVWFRIKGFGAGMVKLNPAEVAPEDCGEIGRQAFGLAVCGHSLCKHLGQTPGPIPHHIARHRLPLRSIRLMREHHEIATGPKIGGIKQHIHSPTFALSRAAP